MKNLLVISILLLVLVNACKKDNGTEPFTEFTVAMGSNSASDVYYSLASGTINTVNRSDWDIAFSTPVQSATVIINEGAGVELYCAGDTTKWESIDENTITTRAPEFNDKSNWSIGAFNIFMTGGYNFGWGTYDQSVHNVYGDSVYVIKLTSGEYKKFWYVERIGATSTHILRWANLDGSEPVNTQVDAGSHAGHGHFVYYSIVNKAIIDVEPAADQWDLLFTRYITQIPAGPGVILNYPVTGVLSNLKVKVAKVSGVPPVNAIETEASGGYSNLADAIGYDWKVSDPVTHAVSIADSVSYFVQSVDSVKYHLYFTGYGGLAAGTITFKLKGSDNLQGNALYQHDA